MLDRAALSFLVRPLLLAAVAAAAATILLSLSGALRPLENRLSDVWFSLGGPAPSGHTVIVSFDRASPRYAGVTRAPRRDIADLLLALDAAGAARILVEIALNEQTNEADDKYLERALRQLGHKVALEMTAVPTGNQAGWRRTGPLERFARYAVRTGDDLVLDHDGVLRQFGIEDSGLKARAASPNWLNGANADSTATRQAVFRIDYGIDLAKVPVIDAGSMLTDHAADARLRGANVIVAGIASGPGNDFRVPRYGELRRPQIIALAAETLALGRDLEPIPNWIPALGLLVLASSLALSCAMLNARSGAALSIGASLGALVGAAILQVAAGLMAPAAGGIAAVLLGYAAAQVAVHPLFASLRHSVTALWSGIDVHADLAAQDAQIEALSRIASEDELTGLKNRRAFEDALGEACAGEAPFALLLCDLDGFKPVNDTLGHAAGDELLRAIATRLIREVGPHGLAARLGGDEFAVLLPHMTEALAAEAARHLVEAISQPIRIGMRDVKVGVSIGVALGAPQEDAALLMQRADAAMYDAKRRRVGYGFGRSRQLRKVG
jgi:diguanylate cyclase (GGDEF)-like protein